MKYKPVRDRFCQNEKCQDYRIFGEGNIIRHSMYKRGRGDGGVISARNVKRLSVQQKEHPTIDSTNLAQSGKTVLVKLLVSLMAINLKALN
jgi:hypothetical protein